ncbi:hypothetical protein P691DRAFT_787534 [Macrolepiota fuliginosa MF-IS2]|uniref:Uncharacterized protein n=1 Tax=Macrolepiota fuliginosa MF-IS2 TaxID=1400762 RepID=A0A9P5X5K1_9AGAR|nr:hypothetical protein P691DRAFT_787534 [Macrolepiota fuliginosa MF-IS2]
MSTPSTSSVIFDYENKYATSYLLPPNILGVIRLLLGKYALGTNIVVLIWSGAVLDDADTFFSYFTHLSYIGVTAWLWASGIQSIAFANSWKGGRDARYPLQSWPRALQFLHELLFSTIATFPFIVTIVYWALLASSKSFSSPYLAWSNISLHILNAGFVLFELWCTNLPPMKWIYLPITVVILGLYLGVAYITYATRGIYPYDFLNPKKQGAFLAIYITGITIGQVLVFVVVRYAIILRERLASKTLKEDIPRHADPNEKSSEAKPDLL